MSKKFTPKILHKGTIVRGSTVKLKDRRTAFLGRGDDGWLMVFTRPGVGEENKVHTTQLYLSPEAMDALMSMYVQAQPKQTYRATVAIPSEAKAESDPAQRSTRSP